MRRVFPFIVPPEAIVARFSAGNPPSNPPPPPSQQQTTTGDNNQQNRRGRTVLIGAIIAFIVLLLLACVAFAPGFLGGKKTGQSSSTPSPAIATTPSPTVVPSPSPSPTTAPTPSGLTGAYYRMPTYLPGQPVPAMPTGTPVFTAVDPNLDVPYGVWGISGTQHYPHHELGNLGPDGFAIRWTGLIQPSETATYTFYTNSDDGVRVWVNDKLMVDNWTAHSQSLNCSDVAAPGTPVPAHTHGCATIALTANQMYSIKVEYYENYVDGAAMQLYWQTPNMSQKQIVPPSAFFHQP